MKLKTWTLHRLTNNIFDEEKRQESVFQVYTFLLIRSSGKNKDCFHHKIMYLYLLINSNSLKDSVLTQQFRATWSKPGKTPVAFFCLF